MKAKQPNRRTQAAMKAARRRLLADPDDTPLGQLQRHIDEKTILRPGPDEDGDCTRCGLPWQEPDSIEPHVCPPGFTS